MWAVMELAKVMWVNEKNPSIDSYAKVSEDFIERLKKMETHQFWFTEEYKVEMIKHFQDEIGKYYIITEDFWPYEYRKKQMQYFVSRLDDHWDFEKAKSETEDYSITLQK